MERKVKKIYYDSVVTVLTLTVISAYVMLWCLHLKFETDKLSLLTDLRVALQERNVRQNTSHEKCLPYCLVHNNRPSVEFMSLDSVGFLRYTETY